MDTLADLMNQAENAERDADFFYRHGLHDRGRAANRLWIHIIHVAAAERTRRQRGLAA